jgi:hypothetical protein
MRIRIQQRKLMRIHADPDPKPCAELLKKLPVAVSHLAVTYKMLNVNRGFFDPSVSGEIMSCASGKCTAALKITELQNI